jgi:hypothetical protein
MTNEYDEKVKVHTTRSKYKIGNVPDGASQQIAVVERYTSFPAYGWSNATLFPQGGSYWGWNGYGSVYGVWGLGAPQVNARVDGLDAAHPHRPNSAHRRCQVLYIDGGVNSFRGDPKYWGNRCTPDDGSAESGFFSFGD